MADDEIELPAAMQRLADGTTTVVMSVRLPAALHDAVNAAVRVGVDATVNDAWVTACESGSRPSPSVWHPRRARPRTR